MTRCPECGRIGVDKYCSGVKVAHPMRRCERVKSRPGANRRAIRLLALAMSLGVGRG